METRCGQKRAHASRCDPGSEGPATEASAPRALRRVRNLGLGLLAVLFALPALGREVDEIAEARERAARQGSARVIVRVDADTLPEGFLSRPGQVLAQRERIARRSDALLTRIPSSHKKDVRRFQYLPLVAVEVTGEGLEQLASAPEAVSIWVDRPQPLLLAQSVPLIGGDVAFTQGFEGTGFAVAVLDTGVDASHGFLAGRVVAEACFSSTFAGQGATSVCPGGASSSTASGSGGPCPASIGGCEHGTHVAGIAAGDGVSFDGVARDAGIIAVQVFSRFDGSNCGAGPSPCVLSFVSDQIRGFEHVYSLRNQLSIASVNMSLGGGRFSGACDSEPQKAAIDLLRSAGIATLVASGNQGFSSSISSPACISSAISVGSTTKSDQVSPFSNSAGILDLLAPGSSIRSSVPGNGFAFFNGTSMAAPHVAGAFAVLREKSPNASVDELLTVLGNTGVEITDASNGITRPRIRLDAALAQLGGAVTAGELGVTPTTDMLAGGPAIGPTSPEHFVYTLENTGNEPLDFTVEASSSWIVLSTTSGTLSPGGAPQDVTVSFLPQSLSPGLATGTVSFHNATNGVGNTSRAVHLTISGAAAANDKFINAFLLTTDEGSTLASNVSATKEPGEPQHGGDPGGGSLWWRWVAPQNGTLEVDTLGSSFDTLLGVYTGALVDALTEEASNNDANGGLQSRVVLNVAGGTIYWIAVDGRAGAVGELELNWLYNEEVSGLGGLSVSPPAGFSPTGPYTGPFVPSDTVYTLTNTEASALTYTVTSSASFHDLSTTGGTLEAGESTQLTLSLNAEANVLPPGTHSGVVSIRGVERGVDLTVTSNGIANDFFASRTPLSGATISTSGANVDATKEADEPLHAGKAGGASVWWTWTAPATGFTSFRTLGSNFDTTLGVYAGNSLASLTEVASNDDADGTLQSRVTSQVVGGVAYQIAVDGYDGQGGTIQLAVESGLAESEGDSFSRPIAVAHLNQVVFSSNQGATTESGEPEFAGNPGGSSVWFEWTAIGTGFVVVDTLGSDFDTLLAVYSGADLGSLSLLGENDDFDDNPEDSSSVVGFAAVAGESYRFVVDGWGGAQGQIVLSFSATDFPNSMESFEVAAIFGNWGTPTGADLGWIFSNTTSFDENQSLWSDLILDDQVAALEFTGDFVEGTLRFAYQVDSEPLSDFLVFELDGQLVLSESGSVAWTHTDLEDLEIPISPGTHTLRWSYEKDEGGSAGQDAAWIDAVEFIPEPSLPLGFVAALLTLSFFARRRG